MATVVQSYDHMLCRRYPSDDNGLLTELRCHSLYGQLFICVLLALSSFGSRSVLLPCPHSPFVFCFFCFFIFTYMSGRTVSPHICWFIRRLAAEVLTRTLTYTPYMCLTLEASINPAYIARLSISEYVLFFSCKISSVLLFFCTGYLC